MNGYLSSICQLSALFRCQYVVNMHRWVSEGDDGNVVVIEVLMMMMTMAVTVEVVGERALGCFHFSQIEQFTLVTFGTLWNIQNLPNVQCDAIIGGWNGVVIFESSTFQYRDGVFFGWTFKDSATIQLLSTVQLHAKWMLTHTKHNLAIRFDHC